MLRDELIRYYYRGNGYNYSCAEAMMRAMNDYYDLKLPEEMFYAASSFSGGCWQNEMCGGLASIAAWPRRVTSLNVAASAAACR